MARRALVPYDALGLQGGKLYSRREPRLVEMRACIVFDGQLRRYSDVRPCDGQVRVVPYDALLMLWCVIVGGFI